MISSLGVQGLGPNSQTLSEREDRVGESKKARGKREGKERK
jgi:hypothetical protein